MYIPESGGDLGRYGIVFHKTFMPEATTVRENGLEEAFLVNFFLLGVVICVFTG
jgi:hypothetical protein